jgi:ParB family transcriptional regulator, chromosome partitioning protein
MAKVDRSRSRLGRGLSSLLSVSSTLDETSSLPIMISLPEPSDQPSTQSAVAEENRSTTFLLTDAPPPMADSVRQISVDSIVPNPHQPRRQFNEESLASLAASIKSTGLVQPILLRAVEGGYQLIAGERRWRAARIAGIGTIPAIVRQANSATQAQMALVENIQREDLNPIDRALCYRSLMDQLGLTQAELATRLGEDRSGIANYLRLLNLVEPVRELVRCGELSFGHAKLLAGVEDILEQKRLAELVVGGQLSVRDMEKLLQSTTAPTNKAFTAPSAHIRDLEQSLSRQLGMRVQVRTRGKKGAGRLLIHYSSLDQFDDLLTRLGTQTGAT